VQEATTTLKTRTMGSRLRENESEEHHPDFKEDRSFCEAQAMLSLAIIVISRTCCAQLVRSDQFNQDQAKLNLCIDRARHDRSFGIGIDTQELIPFEIDTRFVERERKEYPDVTFFATTRGLVECAVTGIGKYGPLFFDNSVTWFWHPLIPTPPSFEPSIGTAEGERIAGNKCIADLPTHADLANFDHAVYNEAYTVGYLGSKNTDEAHYPMVAGVQVSSFDVEVMGSAYFRTDTVDQIMLLYTCLYSPMLELKAVGWRKFLPGPQVWLKSARDASTQKPRATKSVRH